MKKLKKSLLSIFAFCLLIPCMFLFSACGDDDKPYDVKGLTLSIEDDCVVVWQKGVTKEQKQQAQLEIDPYEADAENLSNDDYSIKFNTDGTATIGSDTRYYTQSKDLKTIKIYTDAEHNNLQFELTYLNEDYCMKVNIIEGIATIYYAFSK